MKKFIALFLIIAVVFAVVSCGNKEGNKTTESTVSTNPPVNIDHSLVPGKFETEPVTSAGDNAVALKKYTDNVTELIIPDTYELDGVTYTVMNVGIGLGYVVPEYDYTLQKLVISGGKTKKISDTAFQLCASLASVEIGNGVETIGELAFFGCSGMTKLTLPDTLKSIGPGAFEGTEITEIVIPSSVESIGNNAFANCKSLKKVTLPEKFHDNNQLFEIFLNNYKSIEFIFV